MGDWRPRAVPRQRSRTISAGPLSPLIYAFATTIYPGFGTNRSTSWVRSATLGLC